MYFAWALSDAESYANRHPGICAHKHPVPCHLGILRGPVLYNAAFVSFAQEAQKGWFWARPARIVSSEGALYVFMTYYRLATHFLRTHRSLIITLSINAIMTVVTMISMMTKITKIT